MRPAFLLVFLLASNGAIGAVYPFFRNRPNLKIVRADNENSAHPLEDWERPVQLSCGDSPDDDIPNSPLANEPNDEDQMRDSTRNDNDIQRIDTELGYLDGRSAGEPPEKDDAIGDLSWQRLPSPRMGRRRRHPDPASGKEPLEVTRTETQDQINPNMEVMVDVGSYLSGIKEKMDLDSLLRPKVHWFFSPRHADMQSQHFDGGDVSNGISKFHTLRPLRATGDFRSHSRRSDTEDAYPSANQHNPRLLWTGLGR